VLVTVVLTVLITAENVLMTVLTTLLMTVDDCVGVS
jgi:hypothetical protein